MLASALDMLGNVRGEAAALGAALAWSVASIAYRRVGETVPPLLLNLVKGVLAITMVTVTLLATGQLVEPIATRPLIVLIVSGMIGIGIGDTAYFQALNDLGTRRTLLLTTLAPPMTAVLAWPYLGERLHPVAWVGMFIIVACLAWVISERTAADNISRRHKVRGVIFANIAALAQAVALILSAEVLTGNDQITPLWTVLIRMIAGTAFLVVLIPVFRRINPAAGRPHQTGQALRSAAKLWPFVLLATFLGTYLGIWGMQVASKYTTPGVAQTLLSMGPIFILPMAAMMGEKITWRAVTGAVIAVAGVALLFESTWEFLAGWWH